jgi:hypothetical protein
MGFMMGRDLQMPFAQRLFLDAVVQAGYFRDAEIYTNGNPDFPDERAGSNDSDKDDYIESDGWDNFFRLRFKYLMPIGHGKDQMISGRPIHRPGMKKATETSKTERRLLPVPLWGGCGVCADTRPSDSAIRRQFTMPRKCALSRAGTRLTAGPGCRNT